MVLQHERLYTLAEFREIARLPENEERRLEWEDGVIVDVGSSSRLNSVTALRIGTFLNVHVMGHKLGYVSGADGGYFLKAAKRIRRPDTAFISHARAVTLDGIEFDAAPDLAVEVVSPDEDIFKKATEYLQSGTQMVWAVYTLDRVVYVMTLGDKGGILSLPFAENDTLDGGDVLPGFTLPVRDIFP